MANPYPQSMFGQPSKPRNMFGFDPNNINTGAVMAGMGMMAGRGMQQGFGNAMQGYIAGSAMDTDRRDRSDAKRKEEEQRAALAAVLQGGDLGQMTPEMQAFIAANPELANSVAANKLKPAEPINYGFTEVNGELVRTDPRGGTAQSVYQSPNAGQADPATIANITTMRKDYGDEPGVARYRSSVPILTSMAAAVNDTTAMADLDFIYGMAQIFDPESVVRETEMGMVIDSQSMPAALKGRLEKILNGQAQMGPVARKDLVAAAGRRVGEYRKQAESEGAQFEGIAGRHNIDPQDIMRPLEQMPQLASQQQLPEGVTEEDIQHTMQLHGLTREQVLERLNAP